MQVTRILTGVILLAFSLVGHAVILDPAEPGFGPVGDPVQTSEAESLGLNDRYNTRYDFTSSDDYEFTYFGDNNSAPYNGGTTRIGFSMQSGPTLQSALRASLQSELKGSFAILADPTDPTAPPEVDGTFEDCGAVECKVFVDNANSAFKAVGVLTKDSKLFGNEGDPVGIILDFSTLSQAEFEDGFFERFGTASVFRLADSGPPTSAPEGSTLLLLLGGSIGLWGLFLRGRGGRHAA